MRNESRRAGTPVVFITARTDPDSVRALFNAGADDYLSKPVLGPEVLARIKNRLDRTRLHRAQAEQDSLTELFNRRTSIEALEALLRMATDQGEPASVAVLDVDSFRTINETHGHAAGDAVLRELAALLREAFRGDDLVGRWGDDELLVGMYGMTSADARQRIGEVLDEVLARRFYGGRIAITLSVGVAEYPVHGGAVEELCRAADAAVRLAKVEGRDRVVSAGRSPNDGSEQVDIVIIEDDVVLARLLEHALRTRGYRTRLVTDGAVAAAELGSAQPRLIAPLLVLDWDLPGLDGLRVLRSLRDSGLLKRTRVIMLTARGTEAEVLEVLEAGAVDHVTKPFSVPVLMQRVRRAMER
jgi:diguanylate cyclase (GGDEF)-like protein